MSHGTDVRNFDRAFTNLPLHDARWVHIEDTELLQRSIKAGKVSVLVFTVTFHANHAHNLTRSP